MYPIWFEEKGGEEEWKKRNRGWEEGKRKEARKEDPYVFMII